MKLKAVIPSGGRGTRMQPLTFSSNKHLIPVANKPLILYPIETVANAGVKDLAITYNPGGLDQIKNFLGDGSQWGINISYVLQAEPKGLANIFQVCEEFFAGDPFIMHLGDNIFTEGIQPLVDHFVKEKPNGLVGKLHHPDNSRLGVPIFDKQGRLVEYLEKPKHPPHDWAIPGLYFFDHNIFKCFTGKGKIKPSPRGELEITSPFQWLNDNGYRVDVVDIQGKWLDPGKLDDWLDANQYLLDHHLEEKIDSKLDDSVKIHGRVRLGKNCHITNTVIRGPVSIGDHVTIKDSHIGAFTSIYDHCHIDNARLTASILMRGVKITDVAKTIDDSIIGPDAEITQDETGNHRSLELIVSELSKINI